MSKILALDVYLHDNQIGSITNLSGDRNLFTFNEEYLENSNRHTLSLSFAETSGDIMSEVKSTRTRLPPFFSNLLPEGYLREYLAAQAKVSMDREFLLLRALGLDLPGAIKIYPVGDIKDLPITNSKQTKDAKAKDHILRFSLAGVQLKFSTIWNKGKRVTIPANGIGGNWIVKLPSAVYQGITENEFAMMALAKQVGIEVPEIDLVPVESIQGIPDGFKQTGERAYIIKRFDRTDQGERIHMEDFAQVFGVYPEKKYEIASYRNLAEVIWKVVGEAGIIEFIRRFVFNALIGNGDMHLKNWTLLYLNKQKPVLAPAYDFVSTIPYLSEDQLALKFVDSRNFSTLTIDQFKRFAIKSNISQSIVIDTMHETVTDFKYAWTHTKDLYINPVLLKTIDDHLKRIPIYSIT